MSLFTPHIYNRTIKDTELLAHSLCVFRLFAPCEMWRCHEYMIKYSEMCVKQKPYFAHFFFEWNVARVHCYEWDQLSKLTILFHFNWLNWWNLLTKWTILFIFWMPLWKLLYLFSNHSKWIDRLFGNVCFCLNCMQTFKLWCSSAHQSMEMS